MKKKHDTPIYLANNRLILYIIINLTICLERIRIKDLYLNLVEYTLNV